jgi:hypothetical protein
MQLKRSAGAESGTSAKHEEGQMAEDQRPGRAAALRERLGHTRDHGDRPAAPPPPRRPGDIDLREGEHDRDRQRDRIVADRGGDDGDPAGRPVVTEDDIRVMTRGEDLGVYRAHRRFGGFDLGAALAGVLAATGMVALVGGLAGAIGSIGYQLDVSRDTENLSLGGFIGGMVVLVLSFLVGGWVAGRTARYDGGRNGLVAAGLFVVLSAVAAALGAVLGEQYDVFADVSLPQWFTAETTTATAVLSALVALVVMLAAGWFGGVIGSRYHHKADAYLAEYAQGGRPVTAETLMADSRGRRLSRR